MDSFKRTAQPVIHEAFKYSLHTSRFLFHWISGEQRHGREHSCEHYSPEHATRRDPGRKRPLLLWLAIPNQVSRRRFHDLASRKCRRQGCSTVQPVQRSLPLTALKWFIIITSCWIDLSLGVFSHFLTNSLFHCFVKFTCLSHHCQLFKMNICLHLRSMLLKGDARTNQNVYLKCEESQYLKTRLDLFAEFFFRNCEIITMGLKISTA